MQKDVVTILYDVDQLVRRSIGQTPRPRNAHMAGDPIGHYEGDMLVIDTVGIKPAHTWSIIMVRRKRRACMWWSDRLIEMVGGARGCRRC